MTDNSAATTTVTNPVSVTVPPPVNQVAFRAAAHSAPGASATKSVTVPAAAQAGDTLLLYFTSAPAAGWTGPAGISGLTQVDTFTNGTLRETVWKKTLTAGDLGSTASVTIGTSGKSVLTAAVYSGVQSTSPVAAQVAHAGDTAQSAHVSPTVTAQAGDLVVTYWADNSVGTSSWTAPAGTTQRDDRDRQRHLQPVRRAPGRLRGAGRGRLLRRADGDHERGREPGGHAHDRPQSHSVRQD